MPLRVLSLESFDGGTAISHLGGNSDPALRRKNNAIAGSITGSGFTGQALLGGAYNQTFRYLRDETGYAGHITYVVHYRFYWVDATFAIDAWNCLLFYEMQGLATAGTATSNQQIVFEFRSDGSINARRGNAAQDFNGTLLESSAAGVVTPQTWHRVEARVTIADGGAGAWNMRIDGVQVLNGTGDTYENYGGTSDPKLGFVYLGHGNVALNKIRLDDILIADGGGSTTDYPGAVRIYARSPDGDAEIDGVPTPAGTNSTTVDEADQDDNDYVTFDTVEETDLYDVASLGVAGTVHAVQLTYRAAWTGGTSLAAAVTKLSGVELEGDDRNAPSDAQAIFGEPTVSHVWTEKPGGGAWTVSDVDNSTYGVRRKGA